MPQSLSKVLIHTIFSTKNREPYFKQALEQWTLFFRTVRFAESSIPTWEEQPRAWPVSRFASEGSQTMSTYSQPYREPLQLLNS